MDSLAKDTKAKLALKLLRVSGLQLDDARLAPGNCPERLEQGRGKPLAPIRRAHGHAGDTKEAPLRVMRLCNAFAKRR